MNQMNKILNCKCPKKGQLAFVNLNNFQNRPKLGSVDNI